MTDVVYIVCYREMDHDPCAIRAVFSSEALAQWFVDEERPKMPNPYGHSSLDWEDWTVDEVQP